MQILRKYQHNKLYVMQQVANVRWESAAVVALAPVLLLLNN
jgi:hypothetical protein